MNRARLGAALLAAVCASCSDGADDARRPPVLFISIDTLAARHMSLYGYERETTPGLARFAAEAVVFERCSANAPWTIPSYMSQMTGLLPGAFLLAHDDPTVPAHGYYRLTNAPLMPELLARAGYRTAAFVDNPLLAPAFGFARGFDTFDAGAARISIGDAEGGIVHMAPRVRAWIDTAQRDADAPWFAFVQIMDVHGPYVVPDGWRPRFTARTDEHAPVAAAEETVFGAIPRYIADVATAARPLPPTLPVDPIVAAYDDGVAALDAHLTELLDALRASGALDEAIVVISADHGESMTQHDSFFSHTLLYEDVLHVPLVVRLPGGRHGGTRVSTPVQLIDLLPTLLELADVAAPAPLHGHSLVPALREGALAEHPRIAQSEFFAAGSVAFEGLKLIEMNPTPAHVKPLALLSWGPTRAALRARFPELESVHFGTVDGPDLALVQAGLGPLLDALRAELGDVRHELYRLAEDPDEQRDISADEEAEVERLRALLDRARRQAQDAASATGGGEPASFTELDEETRAELRKLGYGGR